MILDTVILENFGAYGGRQEAELTPKEGQPIVLFGGLNGGGKTTLLDAIQLALYGSKARLSNRGRQAYKDYLLQSIHRGADPSEGAGVTLRFRRMIDGEARNFELCRSWRQGVKGVEETVRVLRDGLPDDLFTSHWDEVIEAYLPSSIAHLFFFDGEQIKELAEGGHAAEILGTAVHSLLGLDLVDRIEIDLKVFERRKRSEVLDEAALQRLEQARKEIEQLDQEQEQVAAEEGQLVNAAGRAAKEVQKVEEAYRTEGGDLFEQRVALETSLSELKGKKAQLEDELRQLAAGPLPLAMIEPLLAKVEDQVRHERDIRLAKTLSNVLEKRDAEISSLLAKKSIQPKTLAIVKQVLKDDRSQRLGLASENLLLDAPDELAPHISHLRAVVLPAAQEQTRQIVATLETLAEKIARIDADLGRVPAADRIGILQKDLDDARRDHAVKLKTLDELRLRKEALRKRRLDAESRLDKLGDQEMDTRVAVDDRQRMLKHSQKARDTLARFRTHTVKRHTGTMETLILESFQRLLRKTDLAQSIIINPETFEPTLYGRNGEALPFDRLSAGERQLLATSMLWGLARASGRPVPTIIDTPLGRLDSTHRTNLVERYFPNASHQVLLLSTDEEIVNGYLDTLKPFVARTFRLAHDEKKDTTQIEKGYFEK